VTSPTDKTLATYQARAATYIETSPSVVAEQVAALLVAVAAHAPGGYVLELGSGPGLEANYLERLGLRVHRTDATPAFVDRLTALGYDAQVLDVRSGDLGGPFDAVLANAVLLHLSPVDLAEALRACLRATAPNGVLAFTVKEGDGEAWSDAKLGHPRWFVYWREAPLRQALLLAGWTVLQLEHVPGRHEPWLHVVCRRESAGPCDRDS
jgi:SAM-dependent methyltransferase